MALDQAVEEIAHKIRLTEKERLEAVERIKKVKKDFILKVSEQPVNTILGVDGGLLTSRLHGMDLVIARAVAVHYTLQPRLKAEYYPEPNPSPHLFHLSTDDEIDSHLFASIKRQSMEVQTLLEAIKRFKPQLALMDGSIAPYPQKPEKGTYSRELYEEMLGLITSLYQEATHSKIILAGVSKDSRSRRFADKFQTPLPDTVLLYDVLDVGERTITFPLTEHPESHVVYKDLGEWAGRLYFFYLKCAAYDRPVRVDFLGDPDQADMIAGMILSQSKYSKNYGYPTILIEADQRAKLKEGDTEVIYNLITHKVGFSPALLKLRRDTRPY
jgi:hypothetical protein